LEKKIDVKVGNRVQLIFINDTWTKLKKGDKGTVFKIEKENDESLIWVNWDNGEHLALLDGIDKYIVVNK
jgi:hypothetical protein